MIIFNAVFAIHSEKVRLRGHIINGRVISLLIVDKIKVCVTRFFLLYLAFSI